MLDDLAVSDVAVALGITANAVSIRLHRAKKALADLLAQNSGDDSERSTPPAT